MTLETKESAGSTDTDDLVILNLSLASGILLSWYGLRISFLPKHFSSTSFYDAIALSSK